MCAAVAVAALVAGCSAVPVGPAPQAGQAPTATGPAQSPSSSTQSPPAPVGPPVTSRHTEAVTGPEGQPAEPATLTVPALGLEEDLVGLGIAADGSLEVPRDADRAGWFTGSSLPGAPGPTVIAGHVDSATGPAVFFDLTELGPGDRIAVRDADGRSVEYVVDRVADHPKAELPTAEVFGATSDDQLRLITCTGPWDDAAGSYADNRVVFATAVSS